MADIYKALSIAGTDPSGGAGIHADLKTFQELDVYGMAVVTAIVAQNTLGVKNFTKVSLNLIEQQIVAINEDIFPNAVKTGMLSDCSIIELVAYKVKQSRLKNVVVDPVMVAKSGDLLLEKDARDSMLKQLVPLATVITPNIPEAEILTGKEISSIEDMRNAAKELVEKYGAQAAVVKGGHFSGEARDILYVGSDFEELSSQGFDTPHTHGTGCTFSAVITAELAKRKTIQQAVYNAKQFITCAIQYTLGIGKGRGPTN